MMEITFERPNYLSSYNCITLTCLYVLRFSKGLACPNQASLLVKMMNTSTSFSFSEAQRTGRAQSVHPLGIWNTGLRDEVRDQRKHGQASTRTNLNLSPNTTNGFTNGYVEANYTHLDQFSCYLSERHVSCNGAGTHNSLRVGHNLRLCFCPHKNLRWA